MNKVHKLTFTEVPWWKFWKRSGQMMPLCGEYDYPGTTYSRPVTCEKCSLLMKVKKIT